jgi:SAM-dependent methyltransferase
MAADELVRRLRNGWRAFRSTSQPRSGSNATFRELFGNFRFDEISADSQDVDLIASGEEWPYFPSKKFLAFCRSYPRTDFDGIPPSPAYLQSPTFLISQAHRVLRTAETAHRSLVAAGAKHFVDLGSYPFVVPLAVREFFGFQGQINVSRNLDISEQAQSFLRDRGIVSHPLDLDPYVHDPSDEGILPTSLPLDAGSVDVVLLAHVIEHLYHPVSALRECFRLLAPGGQIVVTTDNAMSVDTLLNYIDGRGYTFEPAAGTAAMNFSFWRGHVRFYTRTDLETMLRSVGLEPDAAAYDHMFYDKFFEEYFIQPRPVIEGWRNALLRDHPQFRNDVTVVARKPDRSPSPIRKADRP